VNKSYLFTQLLTVLTFLYICYEIA